MATNAAAATAQRSALRSAREPIRYAANTTIAVTAGLIPYRTPATAGTSPNER